MSQTLLPESAPPQFDGEGRKLSNAERKASFVAEVFKPQKQSEKPFVAKHLTQYQVEKFTALFEKYFDVNKDGIITESDIEALNEKILDLTGWGRDDVKLQKILEYHRDLYKCLLMEINKEHVVDEHKSNDITLTAWLKMWDRLMRRALALAHLPQWVQVMPYNLFTFIDQNSERHITKDQLYKFYADFMLLDEKQAKTVADRAWIQMTGNGDYKLNLDLYTMCFSNFIFGKSFYGPGLFILGTFKECAENIPFRFVQPIDEED